VLSSSLSLLSLACAARACAPLASASLQRPEREDLAAPQPSAAALAHR
jgi:hypothetical protein